MTDVNAFKALSLLTTIGVFAVAACTIQLRGGEESPPAKAEQTTGTTGYELARCRGVTAEEAASYQNCKQVWAENRRRFFGKKDGAAASGHDETAAGAMPTPKDQSRILQRYPFLAIPEASQP